MNLHTAQKTAVQAARAAGKLMHANWHKPKRVKLADAHDIKLELDVRCQKLIEKILRAAFPEIPLLGEEGDSGDVNAEYRWVVDPIDGTVNYFFGMPHAAVSIALQQRDECRVASDKKSIRSARSLTSPSLVTRHCSGRDLRPVHGRTLDGGSRRADAVERKNCPRQPPFAIWRTPSSRWAFPRAGKIWRKACRI